MKKILFTLFMGLIILPLAAQNTRNLPLDLNIIIDDSSAFRESGQEAIDWLNRQFLEQVLLDGDRITVWAAGSRVEQIYSGTVTGSGNEAAELGSRLSSLGMAGAQADFAGALREVSQRLSQPTQGRLSVTMLISASASSLEPLLGGSSRGLLRWSRSLRYQGWQVIVLDPNLGPRVQSAALSYMNSRR